MANSSKAAVDMHPRDWLLLVFLSILWGGAFFFVGAAERELPPLTIVLARVSLGAFVLLPLVRAFGGALPRRPIDWLPFAGMGLLNNVIPFSLFATAMTYIPSGMASVLNATTPLFTLLVLAGFGEERLIARRIVGIVIGLIGVVILRQPGATSSDQTVGIVLCLGAALSYGFSGLWARRMLKDVPPITAAAGQLVSSSVMMAVIAGAIDRPWTLPMPGVATWLSLIGIAALSTALAYVVFFRILARSGATNVMLVTLLIPVTALLLGWAVLGEPLTPREIAGALVIGSALVAIDGRVFGWLRIRLAAGKA
jgi:drug/metabolite transporter (DMT)-like permease